MEVANVGNGPPSNDTYMELIHSITFICYGLAHSTCSRFALLDVIYHTPQELINHAYTIISASVAALTVFPITSCPCQNFGS